MSNIEKLENRVKELEFALDAAIDYIETLAGSDAEESPTYQFLLSMIKEEEY